MVKLTNFLLNAPCCFCGYNGPGYWLKETHEIHCTWYHIGGKDERIEYIYKAAKERRIRIFPQAHDIEEFYQE